MGALRPRVFTIPPSAPFLPTLISALNERRLVPEFPPTGDPLTLATATIYLPTRRACSLARDLFLETLGGEAAVLPRLVPLGGIDEDELIFAEAAGPLAETALDLPEALRPLERRLLLAQLILRWAQGIGEAGGAPLVANTPTAALGLADALARLIDDMITRQVSWDQLDSLVPDYVDPYWQLTLKFLQIARDAWPALLATSGQIEPAARRDRLIAAESARLQTGRTGPVIAAGSTASMPSTAALLETIARLPHGAVVLPGLDTHLDQASWRLIAQESDTAKGLDHAAAASHPQFSMQAFLQRLRIQREEVATLGVSAPHGREPLVSEALRPAVTSDRWGERLTQVDGDSLGGVSVIEAANAEEEALAIVVALREAVDEEGKTAALVTPDRPLARRVLAALTRWRIPVEDSGGEALADTPAGTFARLAVEAALRGLEPVTLLALLKHPLLRLGARPGAHEHAVSVLERALLRGPRPRSRSEGLTHALASFRKNRDTLHGSDPRRRLTDSQLDAAVSLVESLTAALAPLELMTSRRLALAELAERHRKVVSALLDESGSLTQLSADTANLAEALGELATSDAARTLQVASSDYPEVFEAAIADRVVWRAPNPNARVRIFGLLEARLQHVDRIVLGGLVEGTWPPQTRSDPWLSRPMRQQLGLDLPERRIGLTAHDYAQALGAPEVVLTRAAKLGGAPTVASRFLQRLHAVAGAKQWQKAQKRGQRYVALARSLDQPVRAQRIKQPEPRPPRAARPSRLSVTEIEHWLRDPYTIYAKHILRLSPLEAVDTPPGARDRGSAIHGAIEDFTKRLAEGLSGPALTDLLNIGREKFAPLIDYPEAQAFWWPRFERIAKWFVNWEAGRRSSLEAVHAEIDGETEIACGERRFILRGRADRVEQHPDGLILLDYKTGQVATEKQVRIGLAPQLTLLAAMLRQGKFAGVPAGAVRSVGYVQLKGGETPGEELPIKFKEGTPDQQAEKALRRLTELIERFEDESTPYRSLVHPMWSTRYGDYDHLARVQEWSILADDPLAALL